MSHDAYLQRLLGKTISKITHHEPSNIPGDEHVTITFTDGTYFNVWSWSRFALDFRITEEFNNVEKDKEINEILIAAGVEL